MAVWWAGVRRLRRGKRRRRAAGDGEGLASGRPGEIVGCYGRMQRAAHIVWPIKGIRCGISSLWFPLFVA
uniref:Uncharacterized protein n=1 Tax=Oryza sativa subsp. indica TaxID=39946 RepID=A0A679B9I5_ORYSI|nr:hypothetical protein [Oryza sativa Indica Group]BBD82408.1 hypothetical protein [Oryza sativa Indica Group]